MALRAVAEHPKLTHLKSLLGAKIRALPLGYLELLWHFTGRFTPQGNVGKYEDAVIEQWIGYDGEPGTLIEALVQARWIDRDEEYRLLVHDWDEACDEATKKAVRRKRLRLIGEMRKFPDGRPHHVPDNAWPAPQDPRFEPFKVALIAWWAEVNQRTPEEAPWGAGTSKALLEALAAEPHLTDVGLMDRLAFRLQAIQIAQKRGRVKSGDINPAASLFDVIRQLPTFLNGPVNTFGDKLEA